MKILQTIMVVFELIKKLLDIVSKVKNDILQKKSMTRDKKQHNKRSPGSAKDRTLFETENISLETECCNTPVNSEESEAEDITIS